MLFVIFVVTKYCKAFLLFCALALCLPSYAEVTCFVPWFHAHLMCRGCILCGVLSGDSENASRGESGDVELGARISKHILVFAFSYLPKLYSLYIFHCYYCSSIHAWYCSFVHTCIDPRELLKHLNFYKRAILRRSSRALHQKFSFTLWISIVEV